MRGEQIQLKADYHPDPDEPDQCQQMFNSSLVSKIKGITAVWKVIKPFVRYNQCRKF